MKKIIIIALMQFLSNGLHAQTLPPPIDLGIENITQRNGMWCWAAAAQQVIIWKNKQWVNQCELVAFTKNANSLLCCNGGCNWPGNFQELQYLIQSYIGPYTSMAAPASPDIIYSTLSYGRVIILFIKPDPSANIGHFIVLRGMAWINTNVGPQAVFYINDPMSIYTQPVFFSNLINIWQAAIIVG